MKRSQRESKRAKKARFLKNKEAKAKPIRSLKEQEADEYWKAYKRVA